MNEMELNLTIGELESYYNMTQKLIDNVCISATLQGSNQLEHQKRLNDLNEAKAKIMSHIFQKIKTNILKNDE